MSTSARIVLGLNTSHRTPVSKGPGGLNSIVLQNTTYSKEFNGKNIMRLKYRNSDLHMFLNYYKLQF